MRPHTVALALVVLLAPQLAVAQSRAPEDGASLEHRLRVEFTVLPPAWKAEQQVMDTIWRPLGLHGVNYYAYGAPVPPHKYAARSDPSSALYQAWFGVYTVAGDSAFRLASGRNYAIESVRKLAEYDQRSWLGAMGDPHPLAQSDTIVEMQSITIDGVPRTLCLFHMRSHSDLNPGTTPLAQYIGMPPERNRRLLPSYHPITLHGYYAFWYDRKRDVTVIAYAASSEFIPFDPRGGRRAPMDTDNGVALDSEFHDMLRGIHIVDVSGAK